jgi:hypothetical protein
MQKNSPSPCGRGLGDNSMLFPRPQGAGEYIESFREMCRCPSSRKGRGSSFLFELRDLL